MSGKSYFEDIDNDSKLSRKAKESPFMVLGIAGCVAACLYGAYKFKHRGTMSTSVYLMQLRVAAQGTVVGCLTLGIAYTMCQQLMEKKDKKIE